MEILFLTVFLSLFLAGFFMVSFFLNRKQDRISSPESDSLIPLREEETSVSIKGRKQ